MGHPLAAFVRIDIAIPIGPVTLTGSIAIPEQSHGIVIIALRSADARHGGVNRRLAQLLNDRGLTTVLVDLLTDEEQWEDDAHPERRFGTEVLAERLGAVTRRVADHPASFGLAIGYLARGGAATVALRTADILGGLVSAVVARTPRLLDGTALPPHPTTLFRPADDGTLESLDALAEVTADWLDQHATPMTRTVARLAHA